jgi:hypothetical protein
MVRFCQMEIGRASSGMSRIADPSCSIHIHGVDRLRLFSKPSLAGFACQVACPRNWQLSPELEDSWHIREHIRAVLRT